MSGILKQFLANPTAGFTNGLQISDFFRKRKQAEEAAQLAAERQKQNDAYRNAQLGLRGETNRIASDRLNFDMGATDRKNEAWKQQNQTRNNQKLEGDIGVWAHGATTEPQPSQFSLLKSQAPYLWMRGRDNHPMSVPPSSETVQGRLAQAKMQADAYKQQMAVGQASRIAGNQANTQFNLRKRTVDAGLNPEALAGEQRRQTLATKPAGAVTPAQLLTMLRAHRNRFQPDIMTGMTREWDPQIIEGERQQLVAGFMAAGMEPPADIMQPTQGVEQQQQQPSVGNFLDSLVGE